MFKFFKDKINKWTKNLSDSAISEDEKTEKQLEKLEKESEKIADEIKKEEEFKKKIKEKAEKSPKKTAEEKEIEKLKAIEKAEKFEQEQEQIEIPIPTTFNAGTQKFEPDLEKLHETLKEKEEIELNKKSYMGPYGANAEQQGGALQSEKSKKEKKSLFSFVKSKLTKIKISEKEFEIYADELQELLLENNVAFEVAEKIIKELKQEIIEKELLKKEIEHEIKDVLAGIIREILVEPFLISNKIKEKKEKPYVIVFFGINGTGKTTSIAKVASHLQSQGFSTVLAAADTFRAASIEQIKKHAEKLNLKVISHDYGSDPAAVGFDAISYAKKHAIDVVLIDTAGRMHTSKDLLREMEKISRVTKPDLKVFVGESITGNDAVEQAKSFNWNIGIDGIILTKSDIDEKGGTSLSMGYVTKKPILYLGTGQEYDKIEPFDKEKFIERLGL